ncbi:MAG TPA: MBL fold metallo-hydrolase [Paenirhodobacter sp.]
MTDTTQPIVRPNSIPVSVTLHGVRGTLPVSGPNFSRYGSQTICFEVAIGQDRLLFDAGTGMLPASRSLCAAGVTQIDLFFTHCHYDHIVGFPFLSHVFRPDCRTDVWSGHAMPHRRTREMVSGFMAEPYCPIGVDYLRGQLSFHDFLPGDVLTPRPGIMIRTAPLTHPGGAVGYRVEGAGRSIAIITDTEHDPERLDPGILALIAGADLMLYDATFTDAEMSTHRQWGHSSWQEAIRLAQQAGVARVGLIHHATERDDAALDAIGAEAAAVFPEAFVGRDGQRIEL